MKTYEEKTQNVFNRIEEEKEIHRKQRRTVIRVVAPVLGFCLVVILGVGILQTGIFQKTAAIPDAGGSDYDGNDYSAGTNDSQGEDVIVSEQDPALMNSIIINQLCELPYSDRMNIALMADDFVRMEKNELNSYYGTDVFPTVPDDLENWDKAQDFEGYGIYCRDGGSGDVYFDMNVLNYSNEDCTRLINIEIAKGAMPFQDFVVNSTEYQKSIINGQEVVIGFDTVSNNYFCGFMHDNVGFAITTGGLSQDEVVAVIQSIIE